MYYNLIKGYKYTRLQSKAQSTFNFQRVNMNTQVLCNKCSETVKMNYCSHCNYKTKRNFNMKRHIGRMHSAILKQEYVGEDITGARVHTPVTESDEMNVKDEINDPELFEDSIVVLKIYKLLQRMKNK